MNCPYCNHEATALRVIDGFYRFFVHRSTYSVASGRVVVTGCQVQITKQVQSWNVSEFEKARGAVNRDPEIFPTAPRAFTKCRFCARAKKRRRSHRLP